jgi:hypothetical protein
VSAGDLNEIKRGSSRSGLLGTLRPALLSVAEGLLQDAVLAGQDADYTAALGWLSLAHARRLAGAGDEADAQALARHPEVRNALSTALGAAEGAAGCGAGCCRLGRQHNTDPSLLRHSFVAQTKSAVQSSSQSRTTGMSTRW